MIPASDLFDQSVITALLDHDPLVADYRAFFSLLDWSVVQRWEAQRSGLGRPAHPESAYLKAFLIRIREGIPFTAQLRRFLLRHPLLVIELGFHLVLEKPILGQHDAGWHVWPLVETFNPRREADPRSTVALGWPLIPQPGISIPDGKPIHDQLLLLGGQQAVKKVFQSQTGSRSTINSTEYSGPIRPHSHFNPRREADPRSTFTNLYTTVLKGNFNPRREADPRSTPHAKYYDGHQ